MARTHARAHTALRIYRGQAGASADKVIRQAYVAYDRFAVGYAKKCAGRVRYSPNAAVKKERQLAYASVLVVACLTWCPFRHESLRHLPLAPFVLAAEQQTWTVSLQCDKTREIACDR